MTQDQALLTKTTHGLGWVLRFVAFILTAGWAFPHVCTEGMKLK